MEYSIKHLLHIRGTREQVFSALTSVDQISAWWATGTTGNAGESGLISLQFGEMKGPDFKVVEYIPSSRVTWECVLESHSWYGNQFIFSLDENDGKTRLRFEHTGWNIQDDAYASCCFSWARYLESLRQLCQTGKGEGFGTEGYRK